MVFPCRNPAAESHTRALCWKMGGRAAAAATVRVWVRRHGPEVAFARLTTVAGSVIVWVGLLAGWREARDPERCSPGALNPGLPTQSPFAPCTCWLGAGGR